jgi:hypothetical protein
MRQNYQISEQFPSDKEEEALGFPLFARKQYWLLHLEEDFLVPVIIRNQQHQIIAFWCFYRSVNRLITPFRAPFFTPYLLDRDVHIITDVIAFCKMKYNLPIQFTLKSTLDLRKVMNVIPTLKIIKVELGNEFISLNDSFNEQIESSRKKRKLKSILFDNAFEISKVAGQDWEEVYEQNLIWRREKKHQDFIKTAEMRKAKSQFPLSYHAFKLKRNGELIGSAYFLKVDKDLIYVYSLITAPSFASEETSLLLWKAIFDLAKEEDISTIDMGTSMLADGSINRSLARYKKFIGGLHYKKYTFEC